MNLVPFLPFIAIALYIFIVVAIRIVVLTIATIETINKGMKATARAFDPVYKLFTKTLMAVVGAISLCSNS